MGVWLNYFFTRISWGNYAKKWGLLLQKKVKRLHFLDFLHTIFWTCWQIKGMSSDDNSTFYRENIIWFLFCAHFVKIDSLHKSCPIRNFFLPEKKKNVKAAMYSSLTLKLIQEKNNELGLFFLLKSAKGFPIFLKLCRQCKSQEIAHKLILLALNSII